MPNIRHDYPGGWQPERSQSQRVLELLPLDTGEARECEEWLEESAVCPGQLGMIEFSWITAR